MAALALAVVIVIGGASGGCVNLSDEPDYSAPPPPPIMPADVRPAASQPVRDNSVRQSPGDVAYSIFIGLPLQAVRYFSGETPEKAAFLMQDEYFPDARRQGINELAAEDAGRRPPYTNRYKQIVLTDNDPGVRATAIRALNAARDGSATRLFVAGLADADAEVRLESAKALAHVPDPAAVEPLLGILDNEEESADIRIAAADALKSYPRLNVARALVNALDGRDFSVGWQARRSLRAMTQQDFQYDQAAWLGFLAGPQTLVG